MRRRLFVSMLLLAGLLLAGSAGRALTPHSCGGRCMSGVYSAHRNSILGHVVLDPPPSRKGS